jgi:6-pyruvoyltetrahydropterin/6-carboxytetrahydropterin synthase
MFEISVQCTFSAAHRLRHYQGDCEALHGHNWKVEVTVESSELNPVGLGIDFRELKQKTSAILDQLDHTCLNEHPYFQEINPSSEHIAQFLFNELKKEINTPQVNLKKVSVWESENSWVTYAENFATGVR